MLKYNLFADGVMNIGYDDDVGSMGLLSALMTIDL